ncbi:MULTISPECIES: hypothetical protein [Exiguobacterium]|uniref:DUF1832 domain-containing protein n=1 Tax=Exiguobacterium oxidotolerans TaxID=223958 RepID=A0A653IH54_9BACL|nr:MULTISPECIES: hypothetical protein [Exiguobacterium]VWX38606.1 conserved hypothetical protein [Exiguobacterium oxidotolerans]
MDSKGIKLSKLTKARIDDLMGEFADSFDDASKEIRPFVIKLGLSTGIANSKGLYEKLPSGCETSDWEMGSIISGDDFMIFKHLIINEAKRSLTDSEIKKYMRTFIEYGISSLYQIWEDHHNSGDLEEFKIKILS